MRGMETSSTHRSGLRGERLLEGVDAVLGLGDDLHVGLALDQQLQAAADDAVVVGDEDPHVAPMVSSMVVPSPGSEKIERRPPTSSARSRMPETPSRGAAVAWSDLKPLAVVAHPQHGAADERQLDVDVPRARVLGDVGQALLRDAVDDELLLVAQRAAAVPWRRKVERMPVRSPKSATCEASAGTRPWSSSAVGRSWRARCRSSSIACVASAGSRAAPPAGRAARRATWPGAAAGSRSAPG